ncbi:DUF397 domain-containing protein [Saccharopolyspora shandongensis]|uniref:DUF397 domain-containing protein n=1 Tax=Saccharopolyspora shandongensis TaxID=418495 RepID=UPI000B805D26|nr:DUF397 domain-containing protein [Saccharopolyspora shandongensis]
MGPSRRDAAADQAPDQVVAERDFHKATHIEPDKNCVRVARRDGWVELCDDKTVLGAPDDHRLVFTAAEFDAFLAGVREVRTEGLCLEIARRDVDGMHVFRRRNRLHRVGLPRRICVGSVFLLVSPAVCMLLLWQHKVRTASSLPRMGSPDGQLCLKFG